MNATRRLDDRAAPLSPANLRIKRGCDLLIALAALTLIAPLLLLLAVAVKLSSPGPVLYKQRRVGWRGEAFTIFKFRSMQHSPAAMPNHQATRNDPRVTGFGRFLRKWSFDELPQFVNVLRGDMSIVGPRPLAPAQDEAYRRQIPGYDLRHQVRPGITGWAQIDGCRGETETLEKMQARVDHDLEYLLDWTIWRDLEIMRKTFKVMLVDRHAY